MKLLHLIAGISIVIIFLLTGQYMRALFPGAFHSDDAVRMRYRSTHIYILLAGLLNIGIGSYFSSRAGRPRRIAQLIGSLLVLVAPLMLLGAFFYEPAQTSLQRPITLPAMILLLAGTLLHFLSGVGGSKRSSNA